MTSNSWPVMLWKHCLPVLSTTHMWWEQLTRRKLPSTIMRTAHSQEASLNYNENSSLPMSSPRLFWEQIAYIEYLLWIFPNPVIRTAHPHWPEFTCNENIIPYVEHHSPVLRTSFRMLSTIHLYWEPPTCNENIIPYAEHHSPVLSTTHIVWRDMHSKHANRKVAATAAPVVKFYTINTVRQLPATS